METQTQAGFATLRGASYLVLTTYRRSGEAVPTPVWFAEEQGKLYVYTFPTAGKVKRIRNTPRVTVAASDARGRLRGPELAARARILAPDEAWVADRALSRKYGWRRALYTRLMGLLRGLRGRPAPAAPAYLEITPD
jgi:PPOX class probable F420-dependent enzyme